MGSTPGSSRRLECHAAFALRESGASLGARGSPLRVATRELIHNDFALARGEDRPSVPIEFVRAEGAMLHDLLGTTYASLVLVSARFRAVLEEEGFTGWTTFPVKVVDPDAQLGGYGGLAVIGRCGAIDDSLSEEILLPPPVAGGRSARALRGLCFPPGSWDGTDVFTAEGRADVIVVERVKEALERAGITNIEFDRLSEIERTWRSDGSLPP